MPIIIALYPTLHRRYWYCYNDSLNSCISRVYMPLNNIPKSTTVNKRNE